jgi:hypothetical protein
MAITVSEIPREELAERIIRGVFPDAELHYVTRQGRLHVAAHLANQRHAETLRWAEQHLSRRLGKEGICLSHLWSPGPCSEVPVVYSAQRD